MKKVKFVLIIFLVATSLTGNAQTRFSVPETLWTAFPDTLRNEIIKSLDSLLSGIDKRLLDTSLIDKDNYDLNYNFFYYLKGIEKKDTVPYYFRGQLINLYSIAPSQYLLTLIYSNKDEIGRIFSFMAKDDKGKIVFACPLKYNTKHWKTTTTGTITIYYPDTINVKRVEEFDSKNIAMASKFNLPVREFDLYMCRNYQEALQLQGCLYEYRSNGYLNSGDIIDPKTLFSVMNDEDFSHDVLHIYAYHIRGAIRNRAAEEGLAYFWGNAYHASNKGTIPDQHELVPVLKQYLASYNDVNLLDLFDKSPDVLAEYGYPKPVSVKYIITGLICEALEKEKGVAGIIELIKCGRTDDDFFESINKLMNINRSNFDAKVRELLSSFSTYNINTF
ncbi:MAG: hypothetical protein LBG80_19455 [Bacteroidales bacterium]|jgi:uncharacterized protein YaiE (UPF0345 family)|nr:hypothetical protein [Bacteroidales bacterium]